MVVEEEEGAEGALEEVEEEEEQVQSPPGELRGRRPAQHLVVGHKLPFPKANHSVVACKGAERGMISMETGDMGVVILAVPVLA